MGASLCPSLKLPCKSYGGIHMGLRVARTIRTCARCSHARGAGDGGQNEQGKGIVIMYRDREPLRCCCRSNCSATFACKKDGSTSGSRRKVYLLRCRVGDTLLLARVESRFTLVARTRRTTCAHLAHGLFDRARIPRRGGLGRASDGDV